MELRAAENLATELMGKFGLFGTDFVGFTPNYEIGGMRSRFAGRGTIYTLNARWAFKFDSARRRFGVCSYRRKMITLSAALVNINDEAKVRDVILHEIAHALCPTNAGHGPMWKAMARAVGAKPERCYSNHDTATVSAKWKWHCIFCHAHKEVIQPSNPGESLCKDCWYKAKASGTSYNIGEYYIAWKKERDVVVPPRGMANNPERVVEVASLARPWIAPIREVTPDAAPKALAQATANMQWDAARVVELYSAGTKVPDIAVALGYERGHGQNRVRAALMKAGVYKK
jgi:predicted SprT family Zn-dependent metalloprotease